MDYARPDHLGFRSDRTPSWRSAFVVLGGLAIAATAGFAIQQNLRPDVGGRAHTETTRTVIPCELTGEARPVSHGAGFVLTGQCPGGEAAIKPSLSLWTQLIEALPREGRVVIVRCDVRGNGSYTDCRKTNEAATNSEETAMR